MFFSLTTISLTVQLESSKGDTALIEAIKWGQEFLIDLLLILRVNVNASNRTGESPLEICAASSRDDLDIIYKLVTAGAHVRIVRKQLEDARYQQMKLISIISSMIIPLTVSLEQSSSLLLRSNIERFLCDCGRAVDKPSEGGMTPLALATHWKSDELVDLLIAMGADVNAVSRDPENIFNKSVVSPLLIACQAGNLQLAQKLVAAGATVGRDINKCSKLTAEEFDMIEADGKSRWIQSNKPLLLARIADFAKERGSDIDTMSKPSEYFPLPANLLMKAIIYNQTLLVELLILLGANVNFNAVYTPLHLACIFCRFECAMQLLNAGAIILFLHYPKLSLAVIPINIRNEPSLLIVSYCMHVAVCKKRLP